MSQVTLYLDEDTDALLTRWAADAGLSKSRWVAELIRRHTKDEWPSGCMALAGAFPDFPMRDSKHAVSGVPAAVPEVPDVPDVLYRQSPVAFGCVNPCESKTHLMSRPYATEPSPLTTGAQLFMVTSGVTPDGLGIQMVVLVVSRHRNASSPVPSLLEA